MPNGEKMNLDASVGENMGEELNEINKERGGKTLESIEYIQQVIEDSKKNLERLKAIRPELVEEIKTEEAKREEIIARRERLEAEKEELLSAEGEKITPAEAKETAEKVESLPQKSGIKRYLMAAGVVALTALVAVGGWFAGRRSGSADPGKKEPGVEMTDDDHDAASGVENKEIKESEKGIKDGYGEKGMWSSDKKGGVYDFAAAKEVAEVCDDDEVEMVKYAADNQVESMADYLANLPEQLQPEGFKGLSILETEKKLESLSDDEYESVQKQFNAIMDKAFTRRTELNGKYHNAFMREKDEAGKVVHENMELVECATDENGVKVNQFYWEDENHNEIGAMTVKIIYDEDGNIKGCIQVVNKEGEKEWIYKGITSIPGNPGKTTPPKETPPDEIKPKDAENLKRIDKNAHEDIAKDVGTKKIEVHQEKAKESEKTNKPASSTYQGTGAKTQQNQPSKAAEPVQQKVSPQNNYSQNKGGANANQYAPVKENKAAQQQADKTEVNKSEAPQTVQQAQDTLNDLGIN